MHDHITAAISAARTPAQLDAIARDITLLWGKGDIADDTFTALYGLAHRCRAELKGGPRGQPALLLQGGQAVAPPRRSIFQPRRLQRSPDRRRSLERRRRLASSGPMPPALAARFTVAELAALRIVADEVRVYGDCSLTLAEIAARAGICRTSVQNALRAAARVSLVHVEERRRRGQKNDPNRITIMSTEWLTWLARGPKGIGFKKVSPTASRGFKRPDQRKSQRPISSEREPVGPLCTPKRDSHKALGRPPSANLHRGAGGGDLGAKAERSSAAS